MLVCIFLKRLSFHNKGLETVTLETNTGRSLHFTPNLQSVLYVITLGLHLNPIRSPKSTFHTDRFFFSVVGPVLTEETVSATNHSERGLRRERAMALPIFCLG